MIPPVARDESDELALLLRKGLEADLLLITGGVSMGKYDLVEQVLASFQARIFFTGAQIQPGRPVVFGEVKSGERSTPFFGLPGNPVSTMVTFQLFARPVLELSVRSEAAAAAILASYSEIRFHQPDRTYAISPGKARRRQRKAGGRVGTVARVR